MPTKVSKAELDQREREALAARIPGARYEVEEQGVTVNGVRYGGGESNRQALREARELAQDNGMTEFSAWKDSDGNYLTNHPVADVEAALRKIGARRSELIGREGQYVQQALAGTVTSIDALDWSTQYD